MNRGLVTTLISPASGPDAPGRPAQSGHRSALALVAFLAISFGVAALGTVSTIQNVDGWYADAAKAFGTPPNMVFGPVWTALVVIVAIAVMNTK